MSTPDFKQKCDEIHTILCYLWDKELPKPLIGRFFIIIDGFQFNKDGIAKMKILNCAIEMADSMKAYYNV